VEAIVGLLARTLEPEAARLGFLRATLFNLCIGNTDNHAKNHGLLYDKGPAPRLAPLYDLLPIRLDKGFTHDLAFEIGAAGTFDDMTAEDLQHFFVQLGVDPADLATVAGRVVAPLIERIEAATPALRSRAGMKTFDDLIGREMERLVELFSLNVKLFARDYFPSAGT
jgi:serine/threonine-protein kinase HipA